MPRPKVRNPSCSGEKSAIRADFSTAATPPTAGRTSGTVGLAESAYGLRQQHHAVARDVERAGHVGVDGSG